MTHTITLLKPIKVGIPGKQATTYAADRYITGSIAPMSSDDYSKHYTNGAYVDNGTYSLSTVDTLTVGTVLQYRNMKLKVLGFIEGRVRNHAHLVVMTNE